MYKTEVASTPHRDAAGQDALCGAPVEGGEDGWGQVECPHSPQEVQTLLCQLHQ